METHLPRSPIPLPLPCMSPDTGIPSPFLPSCITCYFLSPFPPSDPTQATFLYTHHSFPTHMCAFCIQAPCLCLVCFCLTMDTLLLWCIFCELYHLQTFFFCMLHSRLTSACIEVYRTLHMGQDIVFGWTGQVWFGIPVPFWFHTTILLLRYHPSPTTYLPTTLPTITMPSFLLPILFLL